MVVPPPGLLGSVPTTEPDEIVWVRKEKTKRAPWSSMVFDHGIRLAAGLCEELGIAPDLQVFTVRLALAESAPRPTEVLAALTGADAEELAMDCSVARVRLWLADDAGKLVDALSSPCQAPVAA